MTNVVILLGPSLGNKGGMSASEKALLDNWKSDQFTIKHIATHKDGNSLVKVVFFFRGLFQYITQMLFNNRVSVVYIYFSDRISFCRKSVFILCGKLFRKKIILHSRGGEFSAYFHGHSKLFARYAVIVLKSADRILVLGQKEKEFFDEITGHESLFLPNSISLPSSLASLTDHPQVVCTMGEIGKRKGIFDLIEAIPIVLKEVPETEFWFCGQGEIAKCRNLINSKGIAKNVKLLYWVDGLQKEGIYLKSCIYILPSYFEGMPRSVMEAMSYGIPIISTRVNGIPDIVLDGVTGILINPGDINAIAMSIITLLRDDKLRISLGRAGRNRVRDQFNVDEKMHNLEKVFSSILDEAEYVK